ncbi:hypothetical protein H311_04757, partial [Anncaliia algerae PRA109]
IMSFLIQDMRSLRYAKFTGNGGILMLTESIADATNFEAISEDDNPTHLALQVKGTENVLENSPISGVILVNKYQNDESQKWKINLMQDGNLQIVQNDEFYMYFEISLSSFKTAKKVPSFSKGFRLITDDGSRQWPNHILTQHKWL